MKILNSPTSNIRQVLAWLETKNAHYLAYAMVPLFFKIAMQEGVDPTVVIAQSMKETAYFKFTGVLRPNFCNTCGLKNSAGGGDTDPNAHHRFEYWEDGILGHVEHLALYAGAPGYPKANPKDPRHFDYLLGKCPNVEDLSGNWAPGSTYGQDIINMCNDIRGINVSNETIEHVCPEVPDKPCPDPLPPPPGNDVGKELIDEILVLEPGVSFVNVNVSSKSNRVGKVIQIQN